VEVIVGLLHTRGWALSAAFAVLVAGTSMGSAPAVPVAVVNAATPSTPWVVSLGDSYVSGEAGRWAGNQSLTTTDIDALGKDAYHDSASGEKIEACHRSESAQIHIGVARSLNLACSGAKTSSHVDRHGNWKPGIDFFNQGARQGQALMLQEFATTHDVRMVVLGIGFNDLNFEGIVTKCLTQFMLRFTGACQDNPKVKEWLGDNARLQVQRDIADAIRNIRKAMAAAGKSDDSWTLAVQVYPRIFPSSARFRYGQGLNRQLIGGCGFWNTDVDLTNRTVLPEVNAIIQRALHVVQAGAIAQGELFQSVLLDNSEALRGHELCNAAVERVNARNWWGTLVGVRSWTSRGAADRSEWMQEVNIVNVGEAFLVESLHPNYWGQLAMRNCVRQVWNAGMPVSGKCTPRGGLNSRGEPNMELAVQPGG